MIKTKMSVRPSFHPHLCLLFIPVFLPFIIHLKRYLANPPSPPPPPAIHLPHSLCLFLHTLLPPSACLSMCFPRCTVGSIAKWLSALTFTYTLTPPLQNASAPPAHTHTHTHRVWRERERCSHLLTVYSDIQKNIQKKG